jgi:DNA-binding GntR family transcriptional regulator
MQDTLSTRVYQQLREELLSGAMKPGSQLVNRTLAAKLGVSMAPLREALNRLASEGFIQNVPGAGAFVRTFSRQDIEELYVLREALECCAAEGAARCISTRELDALDSICRDFPRLIEQIRATARQQASPKVMENWLACEEQFHAVIVDAARNKLLKKVIDEHRMLSHVFSVQCEHSTLLTLKLAGETWRSHTDILAALREHDGATASELLRKHIQHGSTTVLEHLRYAED